MSTEDALLCATCGLAPPFDGFDDCLACAIAYEVHEERGATLPLWRRLWAGTSWLAAVEREYARQTAAMRTTQRLAQEVA